MQRRTRTSRVGICKPWPPTSSPSGLLFTPTLCGTWCTPRMPTLSPPTQHSQLTMTLDDTPGPSPQFAKEFKAPRKTRQRFVSVGTQPRRPPYVHFRCAVEEVHLHDIIFVIRSCFACAVCFLPACLPQLLTKKENAILVHHFVFTHFASPVFQNLSHASTFPIHPRKEDLSLNKLLLDPC